MSSNKIREIDINTVENSEQKVNPPLQQQTSDHQNILIVQKVEVERIRILNSAQMKKNLNRTSNDSNSKNAEALTELTKKVHPRIAKIGAEAQMTFNKSDTSSIQDQNKILEIFNLDDKNAEKDKSIIQTIHVILESNLFNIIINVFTVYSLFEYYIRIMTTRESADIGFDIVCLIALACFVFEIILCMIAKKGYTFSFLFWLDILSIFSLMLDINIIYYAMFKNGGYQFDTLTKIGEISRVGSRAGRIIRLVRLIRLGQLYKIEQQNDELINSSNSGNFKLMEKIKKRKMRNKIHPIGASSIGPSDSKGPNEFSSQFNENEEFRSHQACTFSTKNSSKTKKVFNPRKQSKVSKILTDLTTKRVIILVMVLVFFKNVFYYDNYFSQTSPIEFSVKQLQLICESDSTLDDIKNQVQYIIDMFDSVTVKLSLFETPFPESFIKTYKDEDHDDLRPDEKLGINLSFDYDKFLQYHPNTDQATKDYLKQKLEKDGALNITGIVSTRHQAVVFAAISFCSTIFICVVLTASALLFSKDANDFALGPIESMRDKVVAIANDPLSSRDQKLISVEQNKETVIIENAIVKIGTLLALGFGEAGSDIIALNMGRQGGVDPMIPGKKKCAIYGFCDIRNFTDATEVLQEDVMLFVNNIGDIVHTMTDRFLGASNKNIGDAFLLVWRIIEQKYTINDETNQITFHDEKYISILSDFACLAFLRIQSQINRAPKILAYRKDKRLQDRIENYKVKMGFGLHIGWGIEGAIGSEFKIDASYLSPNVNMAARLETATKQYGIPLLISSDLQQYFTPEMKNYTRYIDRVTMKGSIRPIGLYTVDIDAENLPPKKDIDPSYTKQNIQGFNQVKKEEMKDYMNSALTDEDPWNADIFIKETKDIQLLFEKRDENFQKNFAEGFQNYLEGNWQESKNILDAGLKMCPDDGPTRTILEVMGSYSFEAPEDWQGFRELTEK